MRLSWGETMSSLTALPALSDNYIWIIQPTPVQPGNRVAIVDPGAAEPILAWLQNKQLRVGAVVITHHHGDHTAGLDAVLDHEKTAGNGDIPVYGPAAGRNRIARITRPLADGDRFTLDWLDLTFGTIEVPGHTLDHIALHAPGILLAGDTLFRAGCGRVFEGSPAQMQNSLARLRGLDADTRVYCGHEYTQKNLLFAQKVEPGNADIARTIAEVDTLRKDGRPSLPGTIGEERRINPFLRWDDPAVARVASERAGRNLTQPAAIFAELRAWKDAS